MRPRWGRVVYHLICGDRDAAAAAYEESIADRDPFAVINAHRPIARPLRESPHWRKLADAMRLPA
jgi:hypothetical protein